MEPIRFYFSFRSPYAWLAWDRIHRACGGLPVVLEYRPVYPPDDSAMTVGRVKARYLQQDIERMAEALGYAVCWPDPFDTDWVRPHAAFLYALDHGAGQELGRRLFAERWSAGADLGRDSVLVRAAAAAGLAPDALVAAADDPSLQARVQAARAATRRDYVFGVPTFIYRGASFWGNDRIEWLLRAVMTDLGRSVPDLGADPLSRPY